MIAGRYRLEREIGRGGSGTVHLALDEVLGRQVAIKRVGRIPGSDDPALERAEREARLAAALNHPHVVSVFDLVDDDDVRWLVMEYVDGQTLSERVRVSGPLDATDAATLLSQVADALVEAHDNGIVHRDVKPSNILIAHGAAKLNDFGIARSTEDASLTQTGLVTGSPAYLAPEVASGSSATPASDVWSLGATLYHAVTGKPPYEVGDNLIGALYKIVHEDPPRLPEAHPLSGLLSVMMTREPEHRWPMRRVRDELARVARGERIDRRGAGRRTTHHGADRPPADRRRVTRAGGADPARTDPPCRQAAERHRMGLDHRRSRAGRRGGRLGVRLGRSRDTAGGRHRRPRAVPDVRGDDRQHQSCGLGRGHAGGDGRVHHDLPGDSHQ